MSVRPLVRPLQAGIFSKQLNRSCSFFAYRAPSVYPTQCFTGVWVSQRTRVRASGTLSQILDLENFRHGTSTVASVVLWQTEYQLTHIFLWYQWIVSYTCHYGYRLVVLDTGRVCECDSPTALLDDTNTRFYAMAKDAGIVTWSRHVTHFAGALWWHACLCSLTISLYCKSWRIRDWEGGFCQELGKLKSPSWIHRQALTGVWGKSPKKVPRSWWFLQIILQWWSLTESKRIFCPLSTIGGCFIPILCSNGRHKGVSSPWIRHCKSNQRDQNSFFFCFFFMVIFMLNACLHIFVV